MNKNNKNSIFIIFTGIIIALGRYMLEKIETSSNNGEYILIIMAVVNYVALGFVLLFLFNDLKKDCIERISSSGTFTNEKNKCFIIIGVHAFIFLVIYLLCGLLYIIKYKTAGYNDMLSILALALSIASNGITSDFGKAIYRYIKWLSRIHIPLITR